MKYRAFALAIALAVPAGAQDNKVISRGDPSIATVPSQIPIVEPPSPAASQKELEQRGDILRAQKAYVDALDYYRVALTKGETAALRNKIGITHLSLLRNDLAKKEFERAIKLSPDYAEAHNNLGVVHYMRRKYKSAVKQYEKAIERAPTTASFYSNLGTALFAQKKLEKAVEAYSKAINLDPDIFDRRSLSGVALQFSSPEDRGHYSYVVAKMFARQGDVERAFHYLRRAIEEGYGQVGNARTDNEFAEIRKDPRFEQLMAADLTRLSPPK